MATTSHPILKNLQERLNKLETHFADILSSGAHEKIERDVSDFSGRHLAIRSKIDDNATESVLAKAEADVSDLESRFEHWLQDIDHKYAREPQRIRNVSM